MSKSSVALQGTAHAAVRKTIGGVTFDDAYAWLTPDTDASLQWQWARDEEARAFARSRPAYARLAETYAAQAQAQTVPAQRRSRNGLWFHSGDVQGRNALFVASGLDETPEIVLEVRDLDEKASQRTELAGFEPSPSGSHVAATLTRGGSMIGRLAIVDVRTKQVVESTVERRTYLGSAPVWESNGAACLWADRDETGMHVVYRTTLDGRTEVIAHFSDAQVASRYPGLQLQLSPCDRWLIGVTTPHDRRAVVIGDLKTETWRLFLPVDLPGECHGAWSDAETYVAIVTHDAPRGRVVAIPAATSSATQTWRPLVAESTANLRSLTVVRDRIIVCAMRDASVVYDAYALDGSPQGRLALPPFAFSPDAFAPRYLPLSDDVLVSFGSFTQSLGQYRYDVEARSLSRISATPSVVCGVRVEQRFVSSTDGATPAYFLVSREDAVEQRARPTLVVAYGGFNLAWMPKFIGGLRPFIDAGGVLVHAVLRGGGEYGEGWYDDGRLARKQHTFDDLYAIAEDLIARGVTTPQQLAFKGDSNGGLTAGVAIVQRPDLWRVVVCAKPLLDMLEPYPDEPRFASIASFFHHDFGDPEEPACAAVLASYSPVHNVRSGIAYPTVFAVFGEHDLGCLPYHGRRFIAALRDADPQGSRHELRVWRGVGHGARDARDVAEQEAEWLAVVMAELGLSA